MVSVIESLSTINEQQTEANVILTSDNPEFPRAIEELQDPEVIGLAEAWARKQGMRDPRPTRSNGSAYPVNASGENIMKLMSTGSIKSTEARAFPSKYRTEIKLIVMPI